MIIVCLVFHYCKIFQSHCQQDDGHCIWYGVCKDDKKNCAYNGTAKALDEEGVKALSQWCSHLMPANYKAGDVVNTCCDNKQVHSPIPFKFLSFLTLFPFSSSS